MRSYSLIDTEGRCTPAPAREPLVILGYDSLASGIAHAFGPRVEDCEWMARCGEGTQGAAERLGLRSAKSLHKDLTRRARLDVWDLLRANDLRRDGKLAMAS